ncbi:hypothetical protein PIB30_053737 [Stylosanthes scabra]|uniref:Uncharacterized protein n=1 Tax=Stylosanthes scabra TaxID=79078 RepID=A0ABU6XJ66_9FABA|nr:hypothetical protein [Stylosanthes scabra]
MKCHPPWLPSSRRCPRKVFEPPHPKNRGAFFPSNAPFPKLGRETPSAIAARFTAIAADSPVFANRSDKTGEAVVSCEASGGAFATGTGPTKGSIPGFSGRIGRYSPVFKTMANINTIKFTKHINTT